MKKLLLAAQIFLLPLHLLASNQIFESGSMVRLADTSAGINEAYWLFDSSSHYFGHYPVQAAAAQGYSFYFEDGSYALNSSGNNQFSAQLTSSAYGIASYFGASLAISRAASIELTAPFSATYSGTLTQPGISSSFNGNLTIYPAQDYAPEVLPIGSVWEINNAYYYSAYDSGPAGGSITVLSSTTLQKYDSVYGESYTGSYTYTKLGPNFGSVYFYDLAAGFTANLNLFFRSPTEVYFYGDTTDPYGTYTDWGALDVTYPSSYSPPAIFSAPSALPQDQILQITGTNSDLSLDLAGGTWTDASGGSGSFTYTYAVQSGGVAGLTLNRAGQYAPASPEHFALRFTDDGVGDVVYSSLDGSQSFNLVAAPTWELYDDFSGSTLDTQKWETWYWPGGQAPFISNGQLKLENGGGSGRKDAAFMSMLQSAGFDLSSNTYHTGVAFTDPSIIGIEADLFLPAGVASDSGVIMELFEQVSSQEIRGAGVDLEFWGGSQAELDYSKRAYSSGIKTSEVDIDEYVTLGGTYRIRILRQDGLIKLYRDDVLVQTHAAEGELLAFFIGAFNDLGQSMYATVDNVRVLRDTTIAPSLTVVESYGNTELLEGSSGYYAGSVYTPLLYNGTQVSPTYPSAAFTVVGVDEVNGTYRLVLTNGSLYYAANFSLSGSNSSTWAVVSDILTEEVNLQQDLDGDGHIGWPPPVSLEGKSFIITPLTGRVISSPKQGTYTADTLSYGFSGNLLGSYTYSYSNGTVTLGDDDWRIDFIYTSPTSGTYEEGEVGQDGTFYVESTGTFVESNISLSLQTNWQRTETMEDELSTQYWHIESTSGDSVAYNDGELNFTFDPSSSPDPLAAYSEEQEIEINYAGALPLDEDWQIVIDDTYVSDSVNQFAMGYQTKFPGSFFCEFGFLDQRSGRGVYFYADNDTDLSDSYGNYYAPVVYSGGVIDLGGFIPAPEITPDPLTDPGIIMPYRVTDAQRPYEYISLSQPFTADRSILQFNEIIESDIIGPYNYGPVASTTADPLIENGLSLRIQHLASTRELIYSYQPDEMSDWTEVARINLSTGAATGLPGSGSLTGQLPSSSENLFFAVDVDKYSAEAAIPMENIEIGGIEISTYTPPAPPASPESLVGYKLVGQFTEGSYIYRHDFFFTGAGTLQGHYFVESNDPSFADDWSEETYTYQKTGATTGMLMITNSTGETTDVALTFDSATTGTAVANGRNGIRPISASGPYTFVEYEDSELPEPPLPVVESYGNTDLLEDSSGYYAGSASTPLLYTGTQVSRTYPSATFTAVGVDEVNDTYRLVLTNGSLYYAANFSLSGSSITAWAPVSDILTEEVNLQQDLDGDGHVGPPPIDPPASIAGLELNGGNSVLYFGPQGVYYGGAQNGHINDKGTWEYYVSDYKGILILNDLTDTLVGYRMEVELRFSSPTAGSYEVFEVGDALPEQPNYTGNFSLGARTLLNSVHPDWQYREDFEGASLDGALWSPYTDSGRDEVAVANGLLSVLIDSQSLESDTWAGLDSLRVLPMSESWEVQTRVVADVNRLAGVNNYEIGILLSNYDGVGSGGFQIHLEDWGLSAGVINRTSPWDALRYAHTNALPNLASAHLRIVHDSNASVVSLAYDVDGTTNGWNWEPLIEYQLSDGSGTRWIDGIPEPFSGGTWTLGQDDYLRVDLEAHVSATNGVYNAQVGDLGFDYFEIDSYTPPLIPVDTDGDGLDDSVETNTGVYVSPTDTGTDPNNADTSGDGFTDAEAISASVDPNSDYGGLLNIVRQNPSRFGLVDPGSIVDAQLGQMGLERGADGSFNMNFDLEMSTDLQAWDLHSNHTIEISVPDQSKTFMRLNVK